MKTKNEVTRADRQHNIAVVLLSIAERNPNVKIVSLPSLRRDIREAVGLPTLSGEAHLGDMRAHGDACGGHGLCLQMVATSKGGKRSKGIVVSKENLDVCRTYLDRNSNEEVY